MPRYEYICDTCRHGFELKQSFESEPIATCPICQNSAHRRISAVPVMFKGSGWYVNDYGKGRNSARSSSESTESSGSGEKTDDKAESKSEPASTKAGSNSPAKPASSEPKGT